ncbi:hypothetical protein IGX29_12250 [Streptomyces sp. H28]|uniref:hypothetical protein n=1 Tax=Streptomyces sp. H28 TaxID=2775865 RepID=UPI001780425E|nr:hypothetical protein [Streptomyces sp. H28]MBD9732564.1 hypothetical protein [Streptomyces sp. H28]
MPADEVTRGTEAETSRARTGPRHAAPKKPLFTRFHMPAGKAIAIAAMPTAVLMGMGFTPTLAQADDQPTSRSLTADEFKDCLAALEEAEKGDKDKDQDEKDSSASPTPSPSASEAASPDEDSAEPGTSASGGNDQGADADAQKGRASSPDSGSDDKAEPAPAPSGSAEDTGEPAEPAPSPSETDRNVLEQIGDALKDVFTPKDKAAEASPAPSPSADGRAADDPATAGETAGKATEKPAAPEKAPEKAAGAAEDAGKAAGDAAEEPAEPEAEETPTPEASATPSPSPSETSTTDLEDCPVATDAEGGVDNKVPLPDDPWFLNASSLLLKGADYKGIVQVRTANGTTKKVLKYVVSNGTDIGDLHQTVKDKQSGKTYHVQAAKGSTSTIRDGDTVMYTESISGKLLGLIPITFDPENPPPLNIPLIYFTDVTVQQAGQFGGTLHVPGLHQFVD